MTADSSSQHRGRSSATDLTAVAGMDGDAHSRPPDRRRSSKHKAPPPPPVLKGLDAPLLSHKLPAHPHPTMNQKENLLEQDLTLIVVLPGGLEKTTVVHGSKPMMDVLVMLCATYHLNPSGHTLELITTNRNHVKFKPNALIGALEPEKVLLKPKGLDEKSKKTGPQMPEATVRLVINYKKTQKTILRVSPRVPLRELLPAICEKCEFDAQSTVLSPNVHSEDTLDLNGSLNDFGLREVYARDTRVMSPVSPVSLPPSPTRSDTIRRGKEKIQKENKGLFGLFRKGSRKQSEQSTTVSAPASPIQRKQRPASVCSFGTHTSMYDSNTMPSEMPKKRRAPLPPGMMSQSMPSDLSHHQGNAEAAVCLHANQNMAPLSQESSTESCFKRASTKRKAPPPPTLSSIAPPDEATQDRSVTEPVLEEIREQEEVSVAREGEVSPEELEEDSSLNLSADISLDSVTHSQDFEMDHGSPHATARDSPSRDLSTDAGIPESAVNGESQSEQVMSCHVQSKTEPLEERIDKATQPSQSALDLEKVSVSAAETDASLFNVPQTFDCGVQTLFSHTDVHAQSLDSNTISPQAVPKTSPEPSRSSLSEDQTQKTNCSRVSFTHTAMQTQTDLITSSNVPPSSFGTETLVVKPTSSTGLKKDMATSTEELYVPEPQTTVVQSPKSPGFTPTAPIAKVEPKPKPSNELTREYIPKVGMTTYTIVPQKTLEKLRVFEVELTLERRDDASLENLDSKTFSPPPSHLSQLTNGTASLNGHQRLSRKPTEPEQTIPPASPGDHVFSPSSPSEKGTELGVKEKKVPPAIRPKPASFRLPPHKRTPGDYVASAAVRRASVDSSSSNSTCGSPAARVKEPSGRPLSDVFSAAAHYNFPPPPVQWEAKEDHAGVSSSPHPEDAEVDRSKTEHPLKDAEAPRFPPASFLSHQSSLPTSPPPSLSLDKLRSFAAPKPYSSSTPSRFAQAVLSAVKKSQFLSQHPLEHTSYIRESPEPPANTVTDNEESTEGHRAAPSRTAGCGDSAPSSTRDADMGTCKIGNTQPSPGFDAPLLPSPRLRGIFETFVEE